MDTLKFVNFLIAVVFAVCYSYQFLYIPLQWILSRLKRNRKPLPEGNSGNSYAVLVCARNEEKVIGDLIDSIHSQTYDQHLLTVFVMADNCTDGTAEISRSRGAVVYERENKTFVGKGYALNELFGHIHEDYPEGFDGYFVFDADNLLSHNYIEKMDKKSMEGFEIITSYRNSKNYGDNWISAGYALWFLRESRYLNHARSLIGSSCAVSGTGFLFMRKIAEEINGWHYYTLTEDIEFSIDQITKGRKVGICTEAELYDEQPVKFRQSWRQRLRWSRGYLQVLHRYGKRLAYGIFHGSFSCYDMTMNIMPAFFLTTVSALSNLTLGVVGVITGGSIVTALMSIAQTFLNMYLLLLAVGGITVITEWKHIRTSPFKKVLSAFTFPLFMFTYIPIALASLFIKAEWKPIEHSVSLRSIEERNDAERLISAE